MTAKRLMVMSPAPTANGDLHLGHLAGPFLAADVCVRYARATGTDALFGTGMHFTQNYVVTTARRLGVNPEDLREQAADQVTRTFNALGIRNDSFGCVDDRFVKMVVTFYDRLLSQGLLKLKPMPYPYSPATGQYLTDAYVRGTCPFCLAEASAGMCETCSHYIPAGDLLDIRSTLDPADPVELRDVDVLVFPVEEYRERLVAYFAERRHTMRPHLVQLVDEQLSVPLPDFAVTQPSSWGIPAPFPEVPGQVIYADVEGMPWSMWCTALAAESHGAVLTADDELWFADSGTRLVYFTGMDAFHSFAIIGTAMLMALGGYVLVDRWITNEFYELENDKFSTSRGHVVSGRVLATEVPRDLIRYHLAATSPEFQRTNFTREALARVTRTRLVAPWNRVVDKAARFLGQGPLPVSDRSRAAAGIIARRFADAYDLDRFSLTAAAFTMSEQLARLDRWDVRPGEGGDFGHQVEVFLRYASPILIDLAAEAFGPDHAIPADVAVTTYTPVRLPRLTGIGE
jgi:methionyl-tRNA synthetase